MDAGDLGVELEADVGRLAPPDREPVVAPVELADQLPALGVAVDQERRAPALGLDPRLELASRFGWNRVG